MGRERQQYSGDGGHQLHAIRYAFGETRLPARFLRTFSEGMTPEGYFLDCWPAYDRLARVMQKQIDGAYWGPLLDHGVGFNFDCWHHWMQTGDLEALREPYPRLLRFAGYLASIRDEDGLLPVEHLGLPTVWIDHVAYRQQRHKQCAFNLYAAAMLQHALAPIARAFGDEQRAREADKLGGEILQATVRRFWSAERGLFVNNLPWLPEEKTPRLCDRSLATAILFDQCPDGNTAAAVRALVECPPEMGLSYPCNANWRYWALAKAGHAEVIVRDFRRRWATMRSVVENNTIQEDWHAQPDSTSQWSHCALSPIFVLMMDIAGIRPTAPGFARYQVRPQPADLGRLELTAYAPTGRFEFLSGARAGGTQSCLDGAAAGRRRTALAARLPDRSGAARSRSSAGTEAFPASLRANQSVYPQDRVLDPRMTGTASDKDHQAQAAKGDRPTGGQTAGPELEDHLPGTGTDEAAEKVAVDAMDRLRTAVDPDQPARVIALGDDQQLPRGAIQAGLDPPRLLGHVEDPPGGTAGKPQRLVRQGRRLHVDAADVPRRIAGLPRLCHQPDVRQRAGNLEPAAVADGKTLDAIGRRAAKDPTHARHAQRGRLVQVQPSHRLQPQVAVGQFPAQQREPVIRPRPESALLDAIQVHRHAQRKGSELLMVDLAKDRRINICRIVAFRSAKAAFFRGAKGDTCFCAGPKQK